MSFLRTSSLPLESVIAPRCGGSARHRLPPCCACSWCAHVLNVDRRGDNLNVCKGELRALHNDAPVQRVDGATAVVQPIAVATALVHLEVHAAGSLQFQKGKERGQDGAGSTLSVAYCACKSDYKPREWPASREAVTLHKAHRER